MSEAMATELAPAQPAAIQRAAELLRKNSLVAFPTETVYGLGGHALDESAVRAIFTAKDRPPGNPLIVHIADPSDVGSVAADWPESAARLAARFWPGPLTLVLPKHAQVPAAVTAGGPTVAVRVPAHPVAQQLLQCARIPLAAPSANRASELSPTTAQHVMKSMSGRVPLVLDGGKCPGGIESTVVDMTTNPPRLLRPGLISIVQLQEVIGELDTTAPPTSEVRSPGRSNRHYAPKTQMILATDHGTMIVQDLILMGMKVGWLTYSDAPQVDGCRRQDMPQELSEYCAALYAALHQFDEWRLDCIVVAAVPDTPDWTAVRDRLERGSTRG